MEKYKLICMSFDGEYKEEKPEFESIDEAWEYSNHIGSRWYFYPFHFVIRRQTIKAAGSFLEWTESKRIETIQKAFLKQSNKPGMEGADEEKFALSMLYCLV